MKKILITSTLALLSAFTFGQTNKIEIGIDGGSLVSMVRGKNLTVNGQKARFGYASGVYIQYNFTKTISIKTAVIYEQRLAENKSEPFKITDFQGNDITISNYVTNYDFKYLNIPLLFRANFGNNKLGYFVNLGPYAAILLNHKITDNYQGEIPETKDGIKNVEWGISTGLGLNYKLNDKLKLSFELKNNYGISNVLKDNLYDTYGNLFSNTFNGLLGVSYSL